MTRQQFIHLVKADSRKSAELTFLFVALISAGGAAGVWLIERWEDEALRPGSPRFIGLAVMIVVFAVALVLGLRLSNKWLLSCPHCRRRLTATSTQVVVASGRCGFCGKQIFDQD